MCFYTLLLLLFSQDDGFYSFLTLNTSSLLPAIAYLLQLLAEAAIFLPTCTEEEFLKLWRLASILLLGFLLPYSTGNESVLLQNADRHYEQQQQQQRDGGGENMSSTATSTNFDMVNYVLHMPLEERLEKSALFHDGTTASEGLCLTDSTFDLALHSFLRNGLTHFLSSRQAPYDQVDLVHVMAMAIHPNPSPEFIGPTEKSIEKFLKVAPKQQYWQKTSNLMKSLAPRQFQIHYTHRIQMVDLVLQHLMLPCNSSTDYHATAPILFGALPHLRASLRAFNRTGALSSEDSGRAQAALIGIALQTRIHSVVMEEWESLLHRLVEEPYQDSSISSSCSNLLFNKNIHQSGRLMPLKDFLKDKPVSAFCPFSLKGQLLAACILHYCVSKKQLNRSSSAFLQTAWSSLADAIEWQVHCWTKDDDGDDEGDKMDTTTSSKKSYSPCLLAALLYTAKHLFYFTSTSKLDQEDDSINTILESGTQLLRHPENAIVQQATDLLVRALIAISARLKRQKTEEVAYGRLLEIIKTLVSEESSAAVSKVKLVTAVAARQSPTFASTLFMTLVRKSGEKIPPLKDSNDGGTSVLFELMAVVCTHCPTVACKESKTLARLLEENKSKTIRHHLVAAVLARQQGNYFVENKNDENTRKLVLEVLTTESTSIWDMYRMALHASVTGNFSVAAGIYEQLLCLPQLNEKQFLWMSTLQKVTSAEALLSELAAKGIPAATVMLRSALSYLQSLDSTFSDPSTERYAFQSWFLLLRLDFLDLVTVLRQLTREMRLTGRGPTKNTRNMLHLRNTISALRATAGRYGNLHQQFGILFSSKQSRMAVNLLQKLALFVAHAARSVFSDALQMSATKKDNSRSSESRIFDWSATAEHFHHPLAMFIQRVNELVVDPMDGGLDAAASVDPLVRAAAFLELIDGILLVPMPFPRDFTSPKPTFRADLRLFVDPDDQIAAAGEDQHAHSAVVPPTTSDIPLDVIEGFPSISFTFYATGYIPEALLTAARIPICSALLWYRVVYDKPLEMSAEDYAVETNKLEDGGGPVAAQSTTSTRDNVLTRIPNFSKVSPVYSSLLPNGKFFFAVTLPPLLDEGWFTLQVRLGCGDVVGDEWEIPVADNPNGLSIPVHVSRSR